MSSTKNVAFFACLSSDFDPENRDSVIKFNTVETNVGNAYDKSIGKFKAPIGATYQFSVTITAKAANKATFSIMKNTDQLMAETADSSNASSNATSTTTVAIFKLNQGDQIWIQLPGGASAVYGGIMTSFSGHLLFQN